MDHAGIAEDVTRKGGSGDFPLGNTWESKGRQLKTGKLLFVQDLGIDRGAVGQLISTVGLPMAPVWEEWRSCRSPSDIGVVVTVNRNVGGQILDRFPNVCLVAVAFTGYDCVDHDACRQRGIKVYNVPSYSTDSVAELTLALAISLLRDIPRGDYQTREQRDGRDDWWKRFGPGNELAGKTVGIVGTGAIGLRVAELFRAFKCDVIGWAREPAKDDPEAIERREEFKSKGGPLVSMKGLFERADIVSIHVPQHPQTIGLVGKDLLERMKPGACLINTARGPIVDKDALVDVLRDEKKGIRAALDVFDKEPLSGDDPLLQFPDRTILTPHIGYKTREALERRARITIENIRGFLDGSDKNRVI